MHYDLADLPLRELIAPVSAATAALTRLDERVLRSPVGAGWIERSHFTDAVASLWIDGELVHLEDLVLHDAAMGIRAPTHELTIAHDILRTRRRILEHEPGWALTGEGLRRLRGMGDETRHQAQPVVTQVEAAADGEDQDGDELSDYLAEIDALVARSEAVLSQALAPSPLPTRERDPLLYEPDWDEDERLGEWQVVLAQSAGLPAVLRVALIIDAWTQLQVLQHAPWLGRLLAASLLRKEGVAGGHLPAINLGLKLVARERRTDRGRNVRLLAIVDAITQAAEAGLKEHDRLMLARQQMQHRIAGRRQSSKLPQLVDLVLSRPMVSSGMIARALSITPQGALKIASELHLRELTGRGRFRAWGII
ncbi:RHE_PE00001 family protein [Neorhizobium sp. NCHU2750]|uniref:RHE_PE00001 family protein n=1 Tax=Neorhizobium sp. NCHU2750 TaxID=1825976 RepID=UPI000E75C657